MLCACFSSSCVLSPIIMSDDMHSQVNAVDFQW
jgi:hypothetical protein